MLCIQMCPHLVCVTKTLCHSNISTSQNIIQSFYFVINLKIELNILKSNDLTPLLKHQLQEFQAMDLINALYLILFNSIK